MAFFERTKLSIGKKRLSIIARRFLTIFDSKYPMKGFRFSEFKPEMKGDNKFEQLLNIFQQLLLITAGDVSQALAYMSDLDRQYQLTSDEYGMANFIDDLKKKGYITEENQEAGTFQNDRQKRAEYQETIAR